MHDVGSAGRGERGRVARRVAALVGTPVPGERSESYGDAGGSRRTASQWLQALVVRYAGVRLAPGRRAAIAVGLLALAAAGATMWWVLAARPHTVPVSRPVAVSGTVSPHEPGPSSPGPVAGSALPAIASGRVTTTRAGPAVVVVDVAGRVRHPGVYRLPAGSRVNDAITAAGGALPKVDLSSLNLAAKVIDGQQIAVGVTGAGPSGASPDGPGPGGIGGSGSPAPVDLNTASLDQLEALPGVGPVLAQHILDWRAAHGGFARVDQLREVSGIGPATFSDLQDLVTV